MPNTRGDKPRETNGSQYQRYQLAQWRAKLRDLHRDRTDASEKTDHEPTTDEQPTDGGPAQ